jgi:heme exporter protein A
VPVTLEIANVTAAYGDRVLFSNLSLTIGAGERIVVCGPNGSGKSTLLKIIAGLVRAENGSVNVTDGLGNVSGDSNRRRAFMGYAGADLNYYDELTGQENLAFFAKLHGQTGGSEAALLTRVGLAKSCWNDLFKTYSSGMRQRLMLAGSLLGDPPILLWDEPAAMLDSAGCEIVEQVLENQCSSGGIALVATNNTDEIERWGKRRIQFGV